jgi:hypothetical protein
MLQLINPKPFIIMGIILTLTLTLFLFIVPMINQSSVNAAIAFPILDNDEITINSNDLLYKGTNTQKTDIPDIGVRLQEDKIDVAPAKPQKFVNPGNFDNKILEKISKQFQAASAFLNSDNR